MAEVNTLHWLDEVHPTYEAMKAEWAKNERRFRGGQAVLDEVIRFDWEEPGGPHYQARRDNAIYINLPHLYATEMCGHIFREAPAPGDGLFFGTLGEVERDAAAALPTRAELLFYNVNGAGSDGTQWYPWWFATARRAMSTGHRWIMVEAPSSAPRDFADEIAGLRPYLVEYSPLNVRNWHYLNGRLMMAVLVIPMRRPRLEGDRLIGNTPENTYLLMTRAGYTGFGDDYAAGGWWMFDEKKDRLLDPVTGQPVQGTWANTNGEIPLFPLFAERDDTEGADNTFSRPVLTTLGQIAVAMMNQESAADFDAWDAAKSVKYIVGADPAGFNKAVEMERAGSQMVPIATNAETGQVPAIVDGSSSAVPSEIFQARIDSKMEAARMVAAMESSGTPDSSGTSKRMGFADIKAPRLADFAANIETAMNTAIHFLELRAGTARGAPQGMVQMPRQFDLRDVVDSVTRLLDMMSRSSIRSQTLDAKLILAAAEEEGFIADDDERELIADELEEAAASAAQAREASKALLGEMGATGGGAADEEPPEDDAGGPPDDE